MATRRKTSPLSIICVREDGLANIELSPSHRAWAKAHDFTGKEGRMLSLPDNDGGRAAILFGMGSETAPMLVLGHAAQTLEGGRYALSGDYGDPTIAALAFRLGAYRFERYKAATDPVELELPKGADAGEVERLTTSAFLARDFINTPANDLGPNAFEAEVRAFAKARKMTVNVTVGDALLKDNFPLIHAVGRASVEPPRLIDLTWGNKSHPKVTLVGKGVTFDTGGLDIKSPAGMLLMKKDMGGAANILGLAHAIVDAGLKVRLRVLLPIVENAISGSAFRPGDVLPSRAGITVEVGNTDAEGRLILADALTLADEEKPDMIIDMATLTGAARIALGPDLPALFSTDDTLAADIQAGGEKTDDPVWRMPLWQPYSRFLASRIADTNNVGNNSFAGASVAALFLSRFVKNTKAWAHLDIYGWLPEARPARSAGGADFTIRAVYEALKKRYS